jgi:hypothetical protein
MDSQGLDRYRDPPRSRHRIEGGFRAVWTWRRARVQHAFDHRDQSQEDDPGLDPLSTLVEMDRIRKK